MSSNSKISGNLLGASVLRPFRYVAVLVAAILVFCAFDTKEKVAYSKQVAALRDSIDLAQSAKSLMRACGKLYRLARINNDVSVQLEALHGFGNSGNRDTISYYISKAELLPQSNYKNEVITLLKIDLQYLNLGQVPEKEKIKNLEMLIVKYSKSIGKESGIYDRIEHLFEVCISVYYSTQGSLYSSYMGKLDTLVANLPPDGNRYIPFFYYIFAGTYYTRAGMHKEAVAVDLKNIKLLDALIANVKKQGRKYANYYSIYYDCYSRMLSNSEVLTREQVEDVYSKMKVLASKSSHISEEFNSPYSIDRIRYCMATKRFDAVLPMLDAYFASGKENIYREECMDYYITASQKTGNYKKLLPIALNYIDILKARAGEEMATKYNELQILYDVNVLQRKVADLDYQKKISDSKLLKRQGEVAIVVAFLLLLFSIYAIISLRKSRKLGRLLVKSKEEAESANKMKTMFLQNMSHEIRTPLNAVVGFSELIAENRKSLSDEEAAEYAKMVTKNGELLLTLVGDVLDIARMESGEMQFNYSECSANLLCTTSLESVKNNVKDGVSIIFAPHDQDTVFFTDPQRVEQVLINYLTNACKFTDQGSVTLEYEVTLHSNNETKSLSRNEGDESITFYVTDTGIGIPENKISAVFKRFEKLNKFAQGTGLGLHICKLIADGLKGRVWADGSYKGGARFAFSLPLLHHGIELLDDMEE